MKIYKYRKINDNTIRLIQSGRFWFANVCTLNDPFECDFAFNDQSISRLSNTKFEGDPEGETASQSFGIDMISRYREMLRGMLYIASFTKNPKDVVMCSHYCDEHNGLIVEIEMPDAQKDAIEASPYDLLNNDTNGSIIHEVKYDAGSCIFNGKAITDRAEMAKSMNQKAPQWKYENEIRLAILSEKAHSDGISVKFKEALIKAVYFCCRVDRKTINETIGKISRDDIVYNQLFMRHGTYSLESFLV